MPINLECWIFVLYTVDGCWMGNRKLAEGYQPCAVPSSRIGGSKLSGLVSRDWLRVSRPSICLSHRPAQTLSKKVAKLLWSTRVWLLELSTSQPSIAWKLSCRDLSFGLGQHSEAERFSPFIIPLLSRSISKKCSSPKQQPHRATLADAKEPAPMTPSNRQRRKDSAQCCDKRATLRPQAWTMTSAR